MYGVREYSNLIFFASIPITPSFKVSVSNLYSQHQRGTNQGRVCGIGHEWNEERIECEDIDIISVIAGRE